MHTRKKYGHSLDGAGDIQVSGGRVREFNTNM